MSTENSLNLRPSGFARQGGDGGGRLRYNGLTRGAVKNGLKINIRRLS